MNYWFWISGRPPKVERAAVYVKFQTGKHALYDCTKCTYFVYEYFFVDMALETYVLMLWIVCIRHLCWINPVGPIQRKRWPWQSVKSTACSSFYDETSELYFGHCILDHIIYHQPQDELSTISLEGNRCCWLDVLQNFRVLSTTVPISFH